MIKMKKNAANALEAIIKGDMSKSRLTVNNVKVAYVNFSDRVVERKEEELEFGEWNEGDELNGQIMVQHT